jgi:DeoR family ulaG and ulaABCDEF operon transcriptional repressor
LTLREIDGTIKTLGGIMHEKERHRIIVSAVQEKPVVTVPELVELTDSSEATIRRDIAALHVQKKLRRVRGGAEALHPPQFVGLAGRPFSVNETINSRQKQSIAREAVALCGDGDAIIINGGTTTFQMVHFLVNRRLYSPIPFRSPSICSSIQRTL